MDLNDFYVDIDGDIKTSVSDNKSIFTTTNLKLSSEYIIAKDIDEIKNKVKEINSTIEFAYSPYKIYSIKRDIDNVIKSIKIYADK